MNQTKKTIWIAVLIVAVLVGAYFLYQTLSGRYQQTEQTEQTDSSDAAGAGQSAAAATDFTVYDANGNQVSLSEYFGKPIVLNFWASWCSPCKGELPHFQAAYEESGGEIQFLMVNLCGYGNDTQKDAEAVIEAEGYTFPVLYDSDGDAMNAYAIRSVPVSCFIRADGTIAAETVGMLTEDQLNQYIAQIMEEE